MKNYLKYFLLITTLLGAGTFVNTSFAQGIVDPMDVLNQLCTDRELKVQFHCGKDWTMQPVSNALLTIIDTNPNVSMIVAKLDSDIKFLGQLNHGILQKNRHYADGFQTVRITIGDKDLLKVKAFSDVDADKRLWDFFFIQDDQLYGILFSVRPKARAEEYQFIIKEVLESFKFLEVPTISE